MTLDTLIAPAQSGFGRAFSEAMIELVERVKPSVVQVRSKGRGGGAGVIWRTDDGAVVTNHHVVGNNRSGLEVVLPDGRTFEAEVTQSNATLDLALLKIKADDLPAAPVADSTHLRVGELVFAVGHPWGMRGVVTSGIVSALGNVTIPGSNGREAQYIRSDVVLAPGNSGGPLLNAAGEVVGINAMIFGGDLAVAIPSHVATTWVAGVPSRRAYLGVSIQPVELPEHLRQQGRKTGLLVVATERNGPAEKSGLMVGDILLDVAEKPLLNSDALLDALAVSTASSSIQLGVLRGGNLVGVQIQVGAAEQSA